MLAVLSACSIWKSLQRWGLFFNSQTFGNFLENKYLNNLIKTCFIGKYIIILRSTFKTSILWYH